MHTPSAALTMHHNLLPLITQVHAVPHASLPALDRFMLSRLALLQSEIAAAYRAHAFSRVYSLLQRFVAVDCSTFYLDIAKDR